MGKDKTDPFVSGALGAARIFKTRVIDNDLNPVWDETFSVGSALLLSRAVKHVYQMIRRIRSRTTLLRGHVHITSAKCWDPFQLSNFCTDKLKCVNSPD